MRGICIIRVQMCCVTTHTHTHTLCMHTRRGNPMIALLFYSLRWMRWASQYAAPVADGRGQLYNRSNDNRIRMIWDDPNVSGLCDFQINRQIV